MVALADGGGTVARINSYGPFGEPGLNDQGRIRFTGQLYLPEAALYHFKARAYSAKWGRFLQTDPIGDDDDSKLYAYDGNDPVNLTDPTGLFAEKAFSGYGNSILQSARIQASPEYQRGQLTGAAVGVGLFAGGYAALEAPSLVAFAYRGLKMARVFPSGKQKNSFAPDFIVDSNGVTYPVPKGATGPTPVLNPAGKQTGIAYTGGAGGKNGQVVTLRNMNPTLPKGKSPDYPNGYIKYENAAQPKPQGVDPYTGKTLSNVNSHFLQIDSHIMNIVAFKKILLNKIISSVDLSDSLTITFGGRTVLNVEDGHFNVEQIDLLRLLHKTVVNVLSENSDVIEIVLDGNTSIFVNLSDDSYNSPEAAQIYVNSIPVLIVN